MPHLPSRPDDHYLSSAGSAFFAGHQRHVMIHRARPQIALSKNSKPSSQRNRLVARVLNTFRSAKNPHSVRYKPPEVSPFADQQSHLRNCLMAGSLLIVSASSNKTHSARILQRFSPIHF